MEVLHMAYNLTSFEVLKMDVQLLNPALKDEEAHIWKNLIKVEQLKRDLLKKKNATLRQCIQCSKPN